MFNEIVILGLLNAFTGVGYSLIAPLYPIIALEKNISEELIGLIISMFAIAIFICSPFVPNLICKIGKRQVLQYAIILQVNKTFT
jgi:predicted MFS family arabinose efflux permease